MLSILYLCIIDPEDREGADLDSILTDAWNFLALAEAEEECLAEQYEDEDDML